MGYHHLANFSNEKLVHKRTSRLDELQELGLEHGLPKPQPATSITTTPITSASAVDTAGSATLSAAALASAVPA